MALRAMGSAFPCPLPSGEYDPRVEFFEDFTGGVPGRPGLPHRLERARIVVE